MRARTMLAIAFWAGLAATTAAIPYIPPAQPVYEAPIDRALQNVAAMTDVPEAQREQTLGRLNLLAYARDDAQFTYITENDQLNLAGSALCNEVRPSRYGPAPEGSPTFGPDDRCAAFSFQLGPWEETPADTPEAASAGAQARLEAARGHYARALRLDANNLRSRLGYAYVLDRLGRLHDARRELRTILKKGLPRLNGETSEWEDHAVLTETAAHLAHLATSRSDRQRMERLRARLEASRPIMYVTPVVVPLVDAPFSRLVDNGSDVAFDFAGTGDTRAQGWLTPDAAWLVWDPEWRGQVRSGFDMIGARTWSVFWSDGFEALRALDDNRDGQLMGGELGGLSLWRDENRNGVSDPGEVLPANVHGITALSVRGSQTRPGLITAEDGVRFEDGRTRPLYDWTPGLGTAPVS
jgi:hypothetical protein